MKQRLLTQFQTVAGDKHLLIALSLFLLVCIGLLVFLALGIHPSERQVAVHYTSFGTTNFYRDRWFYLIGFAVFVAIMAIAHTSITYKIFQEKGREFAIAFAWMSLVVAFIVVAFSYQILKIASII